MSTSIILLVLAAGVPYYFILERYLSSKVIFGISAAFLAGAIAMSFYIQNEHRTVFVVISFVSSLISIYMATKTTNFYKLGYYLIFVNAPFFILFEERGALYSASLLVSLMGLFCIGRFYEKNYASANYHYIRGIILSTPYIGTYLSIYLITLALYPPFPNALYFLSHILDTEANVWWYVVVITLFFGNFHLAMKVMKESLFGNPNANIHYVDLSAKEIALHLGVVFILLVLSIYGIKEILL